MEQKNIVIGTRRSRLALWQAEHVKALLEQAHPGLQIEFKKIVTSGDKSQEAGVPLPEIGGKGLFTAELEAELRAGTIDLAVHSLKDLPTDSDPAFMLGAICERESPAEVLISRGGVRLRDLPQGALVGTSSLRRSAQIARLRPDLKTAPIRGNVETRISKVKDGIGGLEATILARAGLARLGRTADVTEEFSEQDILPAPGQGALAVQCRSDRHDIHELLRAIEHPATRTEITAERAFLASLQAGCNTPVACRATLRGDRLSVAGRCLSPDGSKIIELRAEGPAHEAEALGRRMGAEALAKGFADIAG